MSRIVTKHCVICDKEGHHWNECERNPLPWMFDHDGFEEHIRKLDEIEAKVK